MPLFGTKKEEPAGAPPAGGAGSLSEQIISMMQQGLSDDDIIAQLQGQGIPPEQIQNALNQVYNAPAGPVPAEQGAPQPGAPMGPPGAMPPGAEPPMPGAGPSHGPGKEQIEEIAESIIQEKWKDLLKEISKLNEWKTTAETDISKMQADVQSLKETFDNLHKGVLGKIGEYDKNLTMVGTEIKAMEKVFQKVLPTFTDNVSKLERLTKKVSPK
jgi:hypothetical protein